MLQFFFLIIFIIPAILFLITQQNTLKAISLENREMAPGQVWLQLIPLFNFYWQFVVVTRIAGSIQKELATNTFSFENNAENVNAYSNEPRPTYSLGFAYSILYCLSIIPVVGAVISLGAIVCWVLYWIKLAGFKKQIEKKNYTNLSTATL